MNPRLPPLIVFPALILFAPLAGCSDDQGSTTPGVSADVAATVVGDATVEEGEIVTYTVKVENLGPDAAEGVVTRANLPLGAAVQAVTGGGSPQDGVVVWPETSRLAPGARSEFDLSLRMGGRGPTMLRVSSSAHTPDPDPSNNDGSSSAGQVVITVEEALRADVVVRLEAARSVLPGELLEYTVVLGNDGPGIARGVVASLELRSGQTVSELPQGATVEGNLVTLAGVAEIPVNGETRLTVQAAVPLVGPLDAMASAVSATRDPILSNNNGSLVPSQARTVLGFETLWTVEGVTEEFFGRALARLGDLDGDGVGEVAVGATDSNPPFGGRVSVVSGRSGSLLFRVEAPETPSSFGASVAPVGDQNGDGIEDLAVGAPSVNRGGFSVGAVFLVSGADGAILKTLIGRALRDTSFGGAVAGLDDLDGDEVGDVLVGDATGPASAASTDGPT